MILIVNHNKHVVLQYYHAHDSNNNFLVLYPNKYRKYTHAHHIKDALSTLYDVGLNIK